MLSMRHISSLGIFALVALFSFGCHHVPRLADYPIVGEEVAREEVEQIALNISKSNNELATLRMLSRCRLTYNDTHLAYRYAFVSERGKGLRIEQLPLSGFYALATLVSNNSETVVVFPSDKKALLFTPGDNGLESLLGFSLPFSEAEIGGVLAGILPTRFLMTGTQFLYLSDSQAVVVRNPEVLANLTPQLQISEAHFFSASDGQEKISLRFEYDGQRIANQMILVIPEYQVTLVCQAQQRSVNVPLKEGLFMLQVPVEFETIDNRKFPSS